MGGWRSAGWTANAQPSTPRPPRAVTPAPWPLGTFVHAHSGYQGQVQSKGGHPHISSSFDAMMWCCLRSFARRILNPPQKNRQLGTYAFACVCARVGLVHCIALKASASKVRERKGGRHSLDKWGGDSTPHLDFSGVVRSTCLRKGKAQNRTQNADKGINSRMRPILPYTHALNSHGR